MVFPCEGLCSLVKDCVPLCSLMEDCVPLWRIVFPYGGLCSLVKDCVPLWRIVFPYEENRVCTFDVIRVPTTQLGMFQLLHIQFPSPEWDTVTSAAKELIDGLLDRNQESRLTADAALNCAWIKVRTGGCGLRRSVVERGVVWE